MSLYHLAPVRILNYQRDESNKIDKNVEKRKLSYIHGGYVNE
jgi:hypothetical protein